VGGNGADAHEDDGDDGLVQRLGLRLGAALHVGIAG